MTERSNRDRRELDDRELSSVCGGFINDGGFIAPWIVDGKITTHQPMVRTPGCLVASSTAEKLPFKQFTTAIIMKRSDQHAEPGTRKA